MRGRSIFMKQKLAHFTENIKEDLWNMSDALYENPEIGDEEFESMKLLTNYLKEHHFSVETNIVNRPTAFQATYASEKPGPTIAYLAEYDALPGVGHGCGHNMIGTMSVGAGVLLSQIIDEVGGTVTVLGTPAEETNGAKVPMAKEGIFDNIDVAMMLHPSDFSAESGSSLAMDAIQFAYYGKSSHAAASPEKGINALDSVIQLFNGINALREHVPSDVRMHGVIPKGGDAANVVPDYAVAQFYFRAKDRQTLDGVVTKAKNIAHAAAEMTGAKVEISNYELSYDNMITNNALSNAFSKNLGALQDQPILPAKDGSGSLDMGDVSQVAPAIHPYIGFNQAGLIAHTKEFADMTITDVGHQMIADGALALAQTGYDVLANEKLLAKIKEEFAEKKNDA